MLRKFFILNSILVLSLMMTGSVFASGGISMINGGDGAVANEFTTSTIENGYTVIGQGVTVTIVNGVVTVTKDKDVVKVGDVVEVTGDIETRKVEAPLNGVVDTGLAASGGISMVPAPVSHNATVTTTAISGVKSTSFTGKFFRKLGI